MGRLHLTPGTRYRQDGHVYVVRQILLDHRLLVENQSVGGQAVVTWDDLSTAWGRGDLTFEVRGRHVAAAETPLPTAYTIADFHLLPAAHRAEAWRRYTLIRPLLALPPQERTRRAIAQYLSAGRLRPGDAATAGPAQPVSRASVERYLRAFEHSGGDIRALAPAPQRRDVGHTRLDADVEQVIQEVLTACQAAPAYRTGRAVYLMVVQRIHEANQARPSGQALPLPGQNTIYRRVRAAGSRSILRRPSRAEVQAEAGVRPGPRLTRPLERVEIDHTALDLIVVDEEDRLPIGRPTITLALDVYTGFPAGVHVGFEPPGYAAAMRCLLHSILPKEDTRNRYGTVHPWPVYGLPETLVVDRAPHLVGADLQDACGQLGIHLDPMPVRRPWFKGAIERQFRTHNTGLVHLLPGTTFSSILQRGDYDALGQACITLTRFWEILHVHLLDVYAQDYHAGVGAIPARRWAESCAAGWTPALHPDATEARILLGRGAVRTLQRTGIDHLCLRYQSADLDEVRQGLPPRTTVTLKYDPEDLSMVYVRIPDGPARGDRLRWLPVPALEQEYARGLSLWKHRVIRAYARQILQQARDVEALAAAKARLQAIVEDEFRRTRTTRRRTKAARFLGRGTAGAPTVPALPGVPPLPARHGPAPSPPATREHPLSTQDLPVPDPEAGWGADYGLPREVRRDPWR